MSSIQFSLSVVFNFCDPCPAACHASLSITNSQSLLKLMSIELMMPSNQLILCHPLLMLSMFSIIRLFSNESVLCKRSPDHWYFSFSISASSVYSGQIYFTLLAVQETLQSLHQHHILNTSILPCSAVFTLQMSHPYMTAGKTIALTRWIFEYAL